MGITERVISYIIQHLSGKITKTQLVKLLYLSDIESFKFTGSQITDIQWKYHHYGPYDEKFDERLSLLESKRIITVEQKNKKSNNDIYFLYQYSGINSDNEDIDSMKRQILDTIINQFGSFTLDSLLKYVYNTEPMRHTKQGDYINFETMINNVEKEKQEK